MDLDFVLVFSSSKWIFRTKLTPGFGVKIGYFQLKNWLTFRLIVTPTFEVLVFVRVAPRNIPEHVDPYVWKKQFGKTLWWRETFRTKLTPFAVLVFIGGFLITQ